MAVPVYSNIQEIRELAARETGLPLKYADRLKGETFRELVADAISMMRDYRRDEFNYDGVAPLGNPDPIPSAEERTPDDIRKQKFMKAFREAEQQMGYMDWVPLNFDD